MTHLPHSTYRHVRIAGPARLDELQVVETPLSPIAPDEVRIAVRAFSLNFGDLLCLSGLYPTQPAYPFTPGFEASGVVVEVGANVMRVAVGEAVIALGGDDLGAHATVMTCTEDHVFPMPKTLSFEEACALPAVALTMITCFARAQVKPGERILIQTATGGTGLIAIQLAQHAGAQIFATAGAQEKLDYLAGLGVEHRINYRTEDFEATVMRLTQGRGVDVVINTLPGEAMQKGLNCLAPGGRYVELAMTALKSAHAISLSGLNDNQTFISVDLRKQKQRDPALVQRLTREMLDLVKAGVIGPTVNRVFEFEQIKEAYSWLSNRQNIGKVVVRVPAMSRASPAPGSNGVKLPPLDTHSQMPSLDDLVRRVRLKDLQESDAMPAENPPANDDGLKQERSGAVNHQPDAIAIIGMAGRYPGADTLEAYWDNLAAGRDCVTEIPAARWDTRPYFDAGGQKPGKIYSKWLGSLENIDSFDALFFNIPPLEAELMDPQQRLFLEEGYKAFENAGYGPRQLSASRCGIYLGMMGANEYAGQVQCHQDVGDVTGNSPAIAAARLAYHLNLRGPAIMIDTACSSSLVATHLACQALRCGEIDLALSGGVTLYLTPQIYQTMCNAKVLSAQGRCRTLDNDADGFVPGEGVGAVVLKRLRDAVRDGDHIHGVIAGSGINNDGKSNGIMAPNAAAQEELLREVYTRYDIDPDSIGYIELHGTGTRLGDPIEMEALSAVFGQRAAHRHDCGIGSVKSNIGHTSAAAGMAGLQKVLLQMRHRALAPTLHYRTPNEHIDLQNSPFFVCTTHQTWRGHPGQRLRAAISAFGISGTNAHLVVDEYRAARATLPAARSLLIVICAKRATQLKLCVERLKAYVEGEMDLDLTAVAYTLQIGRAELAHRLAFVVESRAQLLEYLQAFIEGRITAPGYSAQAGSVTNEQIRECAALLAEPITPTALDRLAALWVAGCQIEWSRLYANKRPNRLPLPTYPFARESYWVPQEQIRDTSAERPS